MLRRSTLFASASIINIHYETPSTVEANKNKIQQRFAYTFKGKPCELVWGPSSSSKSDTNKKQQQSNVDLHCGLGKNPNSMTLLKTTHAAMRKSRDLSRDIININVPSSKNTKIARDSNCSLTYSLLGHASSSDSKKNQLFLNDNELLEKVSQFAHMGLFEYTAMKSGVGLDAEAKKKLLNWKPTVSFFQNSSNKPATRSNNAFVKTGAIIADNINLARTWQNIRPDVGTPSYFTEQAIKLSRSIGNNKIRIVERLQGDELRKKGLNLMYAVGKGASAKSQPNLLILEYNGDKSSGFATALVGKGLVMDTGGLNIKPYGNMETMNQDMGGAAACFGAFKSCVELGLERNIVCVLGFANNACGPNAFQPSEILRSLKGTTVEILNTDAEGRLVLADALTYVQKHADTTKTVDTLIDVATLTGACVVALGETRAGLFSNDARLARSLIAASERSLEPVWPMPIGSEHHKQMKGTLSDLINCAPGRWGGACNAAAFLHHFIEENKEISLQDQDKFPPAATSDLQTDLSGAEGKSKTKKSQETKKAVAFNKWAHLDIAGPGMGVKGTDRNPDGSTGFGVSLLTEYFRQQE